MFTTTYPILYPCYEITRYLDLLIFWNRLGSSGENLLRVNFDVN